MQRLLCTIGFTGKTAEESVTMLSDAGVRQVIDIRQNRSGQLSGFAKHPDLSFFLKKIAGIEYLHEPLLAPPPELLKSYRRTKDWPAYETDFLAAMNDRRVPATLDTSSWSSKVSLLCSEPDPEKCHRRETAHRSPLLHTQLPETFRGRRGRNRFVSSTRGARPLFARALRLQDPRKQERQRSPRRAIRSPTLHLRLRNPESSSRDLRERTARQSRAAFRRSPPRSSRCRSRLAQFCGRRPGPGPRRESPAAPRALSEFSLPLQDPVLPASFHPPRPNAPFSRPLLADAGYALSAATARMARGIFMNASRLHRSSKPNSSLLLVQDCFRRGAGSAASIPGDNVALIETGVLDSIAWLTFCAPS